MNQSGSMEELNVPQAPKSRPLKLPYTCQHGLELDINPQVSYIIAFPKPKHEIRGKSSMKHSILNFLSTKNTNTKRIKNDREY